MSYLAEPENVQEQTKTGIIIEPVCAIKLFRMGQMGSNLYS